MRKSTVSKISRVAGIRRNKKRGDDANSTPSATKRTSGARDDDGGKKQHPVVEDQDVVDGQDATVSNSVPPEAKKRLAQGTEYRRQMKRHRGDKQSEATTNTLPMETSSITGTLPNDDPLDVSRFRSRPVEMKELRKEVEVLKQTTNDLSRDLHLLKLYLQKLVEVLRGNGVLRSKEK